MKRILCVLMAALMLLSLAACGGNGGSGGAVAEYTQTDTAHPERYGGVLRYSYTGMGSTFDPYGQSS